MNAVSSIFVAVSLIFSGGYALDKILTETKRGAIEHIQGRMPSLSQFTNRLTCAKISDSGALIRTKCKNSEYTARRSKIVN